MFRGSSFHTIDVKGRIIIPKRFREAMRTGSGSSLMVSRMDKGLVAYTLKEWKKIESKILTLAKKRQHASFQKSFYRRRL